MASISSLTPEPRSAEFAPVFEIDVPRKPYYNPVNLWKARGDVKRKEFIEAIGFRRPWRFPAHQRSRQTRRYFLVRFAGLGSPRPGHSAAHAKPLSPL